jgi:hypothetical protein
MEDLSERKYQKLNYRFIESTSEDPEHPLYELLKGNIILNKENKAAAGYPHAFAIIPKK